MTIGGNKLAAGVLPLGNDANRGPVIPVSPSNGWQTLIDAGGMDDAENAGAAIVDASDVTIAALPSTTHMLIVNGRGTHMLARARYGAGTVTTNPVIQWFGRATSGDPWMALRPKAGTDPQAGMTLTADTTNDSSDGTLKATDVDPNNHVMDMMGCNEILPRVKTAAAGTAAASMILEVKVI